MDELPHPTIGIDIAGGSGPRNPEDAPSVKTSPEKRHAGYPSSAGWTMVRLSWSDQTLANAPAANRKSWLREAFSGSSSG
jgi:hypothetical protein